MVTFEVDLCEFRCECVGDDSWTVVMVRASTGIRADICKHMEAKYSIPRVV